MTFTQPNGVEFIGRGLGDEFEFYYETEDGYRFIKDYTDPTAAEGIVPNVSSVVLLLK